MKSFPYSYRVINLALLFTSVISGCASKSPAEQLETIKSEYQGVLDRYQKAYDAANSEEEAEQAFSRLFPNTKYFTAKYSQLAKDHPDSPVAAEALAWVAVHAASAEANQARETLFSRHLQSEHMRSVALSLRSDSSSPLSETRLKTLMESPHRSVQATAKFSLAEYYKRIHASKARFDDEEWMSRIRTLYSNTTIEFWRNHEATRSDVEALYEDVSANYTDIDSSFGGTLANRAEAELFELRSLQPGQIAPEIERPDLDGVTFRLSDYRGKVVLLSFWGHW